MTRLNKKILDSSKFTHKQVGPFSYFIHKISKPELYGLRVIGEKGNIIHQTMIEFSENSKSINPHIDIHQLSTKKGNEIISLNSKLNYLLFYHSQSLSLIHI